MQFDAVLAFDVYETSGQRDDLLVDGDLSVDVLRVRACEARVAHFLVDVLRRFDVARAQSRCGRRVRTNNVNYNYRRCLYAENPRRSETSLG